MPNHLNTFQKGWRSVLLVPILVVTLVTIGCGGGGGGGDTTAPTVSSSTPANNSTDVARDTTVTVTFSEEMDADTIDTTSFSLRDGQGAIIPAAVIHNMNTHTATLTPNQMLNLLTPYTATLSTAITDLAGNALAGEFNWSFTTEDGRPGMAELIETGDGDAVNPQIAMDANGNAIAVWSQVDNSGPDTPLRIYANRYSAERWGLPELIGTPPGNGWASQIAIDANGNAIAVWWQQDGTTFNIYANRYSGGRWGIAELIEFTDDITIAPQIAVDANGNAIAVWTQMPGGIVANRYSAGRWGLPELIGTPAGNGWAPQIAIDASGNAIVVWQQVDGGNTNIYANRYSGGRWGMAGVIESFGEFGGPVSGKTQIAIDASGNAIVVWAAVLNLFDSPLASVYAKRYSGGSWGMTEPIETVDGDAANPQISIDANGDAIAVWQQVDGGNTNIYANRYSGGSWGMAGVIETAAGAAENPQISIDANGNAIAVWEQVDIAVASIYANRYSGGSWGMVEPIETVDGAAANPQIAVSANGNAIAVWQQDDGTFSPFNSIYTSRLE